MKLHLGLNPKTYDHRDLLFAKYRTPQQLPPHPTSFGHQGVFNARSWGMLGNDEYGDCAWAGPAHQVMMFNKVVGTDVDFTDANVLSDYGACTGFNPSTGDNDNGTDMRDLAKYWKQTGLVDSVGKRHKIVGYVWLTPGNMEELFEAMYLFDSVGIGFQVPQSAMNQFNDGQPWDVVENDGGIVGGHYVPGLGLDGNIQIITWAALQGMTATFYQKYADQILVPLTQENLTAGKSPEGFDYVALQADLQKLNQ